MEVVYSCKYNHRKKDCPYILSIVLRQKYKNIPVLGCAMSDSIFTKKLNDGLKKDGYKTKLIYASQKEIRDFIDKRKIRLILKYLVENQKDGFFVLQHNNPKQVRHLVGFLYNDISKTLEFFDSYNDTRTFYILRMDKRKIASFIKDFFHKYFKDEFIIENIYEFNQI